MKKHYIGLGGIADEILESATDLKLYKLQYNDKLGIFYARLDITEERTIFNTGFSINEIIFRDEEEYSRFSEKINAMLEEG